MVGGAGLLQHRVAIELGMRRGVVAAVEELLVRFLHAVVGKRMPRNLPPGQARARR